MRTPSLPRLADYPAHWAQARPDSDAIVDGASVMSYVAFNDLIQRLAASMLSFGVRRGDRVAMLATPRTEHLAVFMAAARIGAIWLGLNPRYQQSELQHILGDAQPRLLVAMLEIDGRNYSKDLAALKASHLPDTLVITLDQAQSGHLQWEEFVAAGMPLAPNALKAAVDQVRAEDPALIVYTSGSTGAPKGALLSHRSIVTSARIQCEHWWAEPFRLLNNLPINHVGGAVELASHAIIAGGTNVLMSRFDPVSLPRVIREQRISIIHQVPTMYQLLLDKGLPTPADLATLQAIIWSGAAAPRGLITQLRTYCAHLFTAYGMTETCGEVLYTPSNADDETLSLSVGSPVAEIPLRLGKLDGSGPTDETHGEIQVDGPTKMSGYFGLPEATAQAFTADGWLRTGDIGERGPDGAYRLTGRLREMYKSGGYNIYPREVELVIERHPAIAMAAVVGIPDPTYGEVGHAWILSADTAIDPDELDAFCRAHLANYKVPKFFSVRSELPMLPIHKLDKVILRRWSVEGAR